MAMQSSSSTTTANPTPSKTHDTNDHDNNTFSPAGSPPLILAFLAIGLFSGAMIIVFGWRRVFGPRRTVTDVLTRRDSPERKPTFVLPAKPKLWNLWDADELTWQQISTGSPTGVQQGPVRDWAKLMPLSAKVLGETNEIEETASARTPSTGVPDEQGRDHRRETLSRLNSLVVIVRRLWQPRRGNTSPVKALPAPQQQDEPAMPKKLQVAVVITLPDAQYPIYSRERTAYGYPEDKKLRKRKELPEFSIGLQDLDWE